MNYKLRIKYIPIKCTIFNQYECFICTVIIFNLYYSVHDTDGIVITAGATRLAMNDLWVTLSHFVVILKFG